MRRAVFLDRDGTLNEDVGYLDNLERLRILPGAVEAVRAFNERGLLVIVVTNQSGVARGFFDEAFVTQVHEHMRKLFQRGGAVIDAFYYCPHHPDFPGPYGQACKCRKPEPGMLIRAAAEWDIDLGRSFMIGDMPKDVEVIRRMGGRGILLAGEGIPTAAEADYIARDLRAAAAWIMGELAREGMNP